MAEREKDNVAQEFASKTQEIRDAQQPTEAAIQLFKRNVEFLVNVAEGDTDQARA